MISSAPSLSLAMRGGDAARALLAAFGVIKKVDILERAGFDDAARRLALMLLAEIEGPTNALAKRLEDELGVNWSKLSPAKREAAIVKAETLIGELGRRVAPDLAQVLRGNAQTLIKATRQAAIGRFELPIAAKLDESGVDSKAMQHLAGAHELFVRDQYGRISTIFGARARAIVETGISQGYDYQEIGKNMFATIGAQLGKGQPYCTMVASVFVARARSASILASFDEAEIEKFELSAVLDEATCFAGWTRVLMGDGRTWAPIHKLRAGDVVMSCKGRPRHVVRRVESKARTWVSLLVRGARRPIQVTQTHGMLTPSGWVRAQHLRAEGTPAKKGVPPITRLALYDPANQRLDAGRLWSDEREWGMRLGRIDPHTVDCHPYPAPDLAHLGAYGAFGEILEAEQETLGQTPTSCADAFDLEIDEDNGYIAEGVVVHNSNICRALDGKVFYTREAIAKLEQVARADKPDAIKDLQPFVQDGKDEEGNPILYANQGGARVQVARVVESGAGKRDERGKYEGMLNEAKLSSMGVTTPPFHGRCRTLCIVAGSEHIGGGSRGGDAAPTQVQVPVAVKPPPRPAAAPQPAPSPAPVQVLPAKPTKPVDPNADLLLPLPAGLAKPTTFVNARGVRVPVFEGKRSAAQLRGVETLYTMTADEEQVVFASSSTMGVKPAPAKGNPMPYADKLRGLGTIEQILAAHGEPFVVGDKALDVVQATQRTVDRRAVASMIAQPLATPDVVPTYVKYSGKLYLHAGHEELMAAELGALTKGERASRLIDLDKLGEAEKPETKAWLAGLKADVGSPAPEKQKAVREALRAQIRSYGMVTRDDRRGGKPGQGFPVPGLEMNQAIVENVAGADATHGWQGQTTMSGTTLVKTRNATTSLLEDPNYVSRSLAQGQDPAELTRRLDGLRVLLHEEIHGASPALSTSYRGVGVGIEEASTEILARKVARDVVGMKNGWALPTKDATTGTYSGGFDVYGKYISGLFTEVAKVTGDAGINDRIEAALLETRRWHAGEVYRTGEDQIRDFASRLHGADGKPLEDGLRAQLTAALSSASGPFAGD